MTQTGWIIVGIVVIFAIMLVALLMRKKPADTAPGEPSAKQLLPEQVTPEPLDHPEPVAVTSAPQTIAAEETPPAQPALPVVEPAPAPVAVAPQEAAITPEPVSEPIVVTMPQAASVAVSGDGDNLLKLKGVGPKIAALLKAEGITRFAEIAAWGPADISAIDAKLGSFAGRPTRDNWIDQARFLANGDVAGYETKYGKL